MARPRFPSWTLLAVVLCDGRAMADALPGQQERFLLADKGGQKGVLSWLPLSWLLGSKNHQKPWMHPNIVEELPTKNERQDMNVYEHKQRLYYFAYWCFACVAAFGLVVEIIAFVARQCCDTSYHAVSQQDVEARDVPSVVEMAKRSLTQLSLEKTAPASDGKLTVGSAKHYAKLRNHYSRTDIAFALYGASYEYFCCGLVAYAVYNGLIDVECGLDFELYVPWVVEGFIIHLICVISSIVMYTKAPSASGPLVKNHPSITVAISLVPFISERWNLLRDWITVGIYISQGHWISYCCAAIVLLSLVVVFLKCMQTPQNMRSVRNAYWPLLLDHAAKDASFVTESLLGQKVRELMEKRIPPRQEHQSYRRKIWKASIMQMVSATREHKRIHTCYGEFPQGVAAVLFMTHNQFSTFVLLCLIIYICKAVMLVILRPFALCFLAAMGETWTCLNGADVSQIMTGKVPFPCPLDWRRVLQWACDWRYLTLTAFGMLLQRHEYQEEAIEAAILGLGTLYEHQDDPELIQALVKFLREVMTQSPDLEDPVIATLLKLCPGTEKKDLKSVVPSGGNLGYVPSGDAIEEAHKLVQLMQDGSHDWMKVLENSKCKAYANLHGTSSDDLMICYSDLEPDDSMAISQLWQWNFEHLSMKKEPLIIYGADFADKDHTTVFEKKVLMTQLMVGSRDFYVCTPDPEFYAREEKAGNKTKRNHKNHAHWESQRDRNLAEVCEKIANHEGPNLHFYIMAPGRGNLGAIVAKLKTMGKWPLQKSCKIFFYSGSFNMRGMTVKDLEAMREFADLASKDGNHLVDAAKFPFFGGKDCHPVTSSFTTFAPPQFAADLNLVAQPVLIALLKLLNDEHNMGLIHPDKLYKKGDDVLGRLQEHEKKRFATMKDKFKEETLQEYCEGIMNDFVLYCKVPDFKKSTIAAFASGCCDSPLCDQLIFMIEYFKETRPQALKNTAVGKWTVNPEKGFTSVDTKAALSAGDTRATQPVLADHMDEDALSLGRLALQDYLLRHLRKFGKHSFARRAGSRLES